MYRSFVGLLVIPWLVFSQAPPRSVTDPGVVVTRQATTPAGIQSVFDGRVYGVSFGASSSDLWVLGAKHIVHLDWRANRLLHRVPFRGSPGLQGLVFDRATGRPFATSSDYLVAVENGAAGTLADRLGTSLTGAPAVQPQTVDGRRLALIPLIANNQLAVLDLASNRLVGRVPTGIAPFAAVVGSDGASAFVSNWGGRVASRGDLTAPAGLARRSDRVVIDRRGVASTGTVTRIDLHTLRATAAIEVGLHPTALVWDEPRQLLYVAIGNQDAVAVVDTRQNRLLRSLPVQPFGQRVSGVAPTALALDAQGARLYVACGGINAIAVLDARDGRMEGLIPTGWYPSSLALSPDGAYLAVGTLLGVGSGWRDEPRKRFVHSNRGTAAVIPVPDAAQLAAYTRAVAENNRLPMGAVSPAAAWPHPVEHVVFIVKENRTYDQVFGDIAKGNGDPTLVMFGEDVTPNQHRLANQFVLLDNFYASGGNSGDGHQWITQANETDYGMWPGWTGRSYPFDGTDPMVASSHGFLWDYALRAGKSVRVYGEYAPRVNEAHHAERIKLFARWQRGDDFAHDWHTRSPIPPLDGVLARHFPGYSTAIPDLVRARLFLTDVARWTSAGSMPHLVLVQLPSNHTRGTVPGTHTPRAMVADNDLALGQIVEALTHTPFWKSMSIFVVEDDAQNGVDHVDGHRTVALAISPYVRRGHVDSTFYAHTSMLKTIELMLGLPAMSLFDLIANDMRASFTSRPDFAPYTAVQPRQSLFELNPPLQSLRGPARQAARASMRMRFDIPDAAPSERLNRILWSQVRGWQAPYPAVRRAAFAPLAVDLDDDDR